MQKEKEEEEVKEGTIEVKGKIVIEDITPKFKISLNSTQKRQQENVAMGHIENFDTLHNELIDIKDSTKTLEMLNHINEIKSQTAGMIYCNTVKDNHRFIGTMIHQEEDKLLWKLAKIFTLTSQFFLMLMVPVLLLAHALHILKYSGVVALTFGILRVLQILNTCFKKNKKSAKIIRIVFSLACIIAAHYNAIRFMQDFDYVENLDASLVIFGLILVFEVLV
jgi:hypothetical protein